MDDKVDITMHIKEVAVAEEVLFDRAHHAAKEEHARSVWATLKRERRSVLWSVAVSAAIIMEGYDIVLVTSLFAQPAFAERYGSYMGEAAGFQIPAPWQSALGIAPVLGAIVGAFLNGWLAHRYGYRRVLLISLLAITIFIALLFFATSLVMILVGLILCGVPWGVFATLAPAYASEVCSLKLRGYMTVYVNLCWAVGQLLAAAVLKAYAERTDQWAYRMPFALQWVFPLPLALIVWFCPESPWWLVRQGRLKEARHAIVRLASGMSTVTSEDTLALIQHTNRIEDEAETGTSYLTCFQGTNLRRTEIICMAFAAQIWSGGPLGGTPAYFFVQAGLPSSTAFTFSVVGQALASFGTIISWGLITRFGRRTLYNWGLAVLSVCLCTTGIVAAASHSSVSGYVQAGLVLGWLLAYYLTVGPVCYAIISEMSAVRLRSKSVCLSRISYYFSQVIGNVIQPYMINPSKANWQGRTAFFWAATCALCFIWSFLRLPESMNRSYEELDVLFQAKVPAREFSKARVNAYVAKEDRVQK